jgi:peptide/nickel transport system substrate-binding protein
MNPKKTKRLLMKWVPIMLGAFLSLSPAALASPPKGVLKQAIHWSVSADWLDPATASHTISSHHPLYLFHDALLKPMPEGNFTPCLAESWSVSPDARVYEFKIRKGVKFHNGDTLTAEDVVFSFWRYKATQAKSIHDRTEKAEAVNPYLVRILFKEPFPDFLDNLLPGATSMGWIVPKKYVEQVGEAGFKKKPVGAGPYRCIEFVPGVRLVAEAFEDFWRKVPRVKRLEFHTIRDPGTRLAMVRRGEMDIGTLLQGVFYEDAKKDPKIKLLTPLSATRWIIFFTTQWDPKSPWSDPRVRKAASLAIDRKTVAEIQTPGAEPIGSVGLEGDPFAVHFPPDPYDPGRARKLLAEAGYPNGFHGGKFYPSEGGYWPYGEQVANYWKAIGITVDLLLLDKAAVFAMRETGKMKGSTFVDSMVPPTIGASLAYRFTAGSYGNYPDILELWNRYRKEVAPESRKELIARIQQLIYERTMWISVTNTTSPAALGPRVKGNPYKVQPLIWFTAPFEDIELVE